MSEKASTARTSASKSQLVESSPSLFGLRKQLKGLQFRLKEQNIKRQGYLDRQASQQAQKRSISIEIDHLQQHCREAVDQCELLTDQSANIRASIKQNIELKEQLQSLLKTQKRESQDASKKSLFLKNQIKQKQAHLEHILIENGEIEKIISNCKSQTDSNMLEITKVSVPVQRQIIHARTLAALLEAFTKRKGQARAGLIALDDEQKHISSKVSTLRTKVQVLKDEILDKQLENDSKISCNRQLLCKNQKLKANLRSSLEHLNLLQSSIKALSSQLQAVQGVD